MHELIAVLIPEQTGARRGGVIDKSVVDWELERLARRNLGFGYDAWYPVHPGHWASDPSLSPPARGEVRRSDAVGSYTYPVFYALDMFDLGVHLGAIVGPDGSYHSDWERPGDGASEDDYELFRRHQGCLVVTCDVHF